MPKSKAAGSSAERPRMSVSFDRRLFERGKYFRMQSVAAGDEYLPQVEVLTIMDEVMSNSGLTPAEEVKLNRMLGLRMRSIPNGGIAWEQAEFWQAVRDQAGSEIAEAKKFAEDLSDLPRDWRAAHASLNKLHETLLTQGTE